MAGYQLDYTPFSLVELTLIEIAKHICKISSIQSQLLAQLNYMKCHSTIEEVEPTTKKYDENIAKIIKSLEIPHVLAAQLFSVTKRIGYVITSWLDEIHEDDPKAKLEDYLVHMKWSKYGIDTTETLRSLYWSNKLSFDSETFIKLCNNCVEDCIFDLCGKLWWYYTIFKITPVITPVSLSTSRIALYWYLHVTENLSQNHENDFEDFRKNRKASQEFLFTQSCLKGNYEAAKYFWNLMDSKTKYNSLRSIAGCLTSNPHTQCELIRMEMMIFIWNQCCLYNIYDYQWRFHGGPVMRERVENWPWREIILRTFRSAIVNNPQVDYQKTFENLFEYLPKKLSKYSAFVELLTFAWQTCPFHIKKSLEYSIFVDELLIDFIYGNGGDNDNRLNFLRIVINDPALRDTTRHRFLKSVIRILIMYKNELFSKDSMIDRTLSKLNCSEREKEWAWGEIRETIQQVGYGPMDDSEESADDC
uniref:Uncharacterized protein n=1 Tax=Bracon brevicornis TaxID=1563983 RepID=A0A6V7HP60_9HYME